MGHLTFSRMVANLFDQNHGVFFFLFPAGFLPIIFESEMFGTFHSILKGSLFLDLRKVLGNPPSRSSSRSQQNLCGAVESVSCSTLLLLGLCCCTFELVHSPFLLLPGFSIWINWTFPLFQKLRRINIYLAKKMFSIL